VSPLFERSEFRTVRRFRFKSRIRTNVGVAFSLVTFFWRSKRKLLPRPA